MTKQIVSKKTENSNELYTVLPDCIGGLKHLPK